MTHNGKLTENKNVWRMRIYDGGGGGGGGAGAAVPETNTCLTATTVVPATRSVYFW